MDKFANRLAVTKTGETDYGFIRPAHPGALIRETLEGIFEESGKK